MQERKACNNVQVSEAKAVPMHLAGFSLLVLFLTYVGVFCGSDVAEKGSLPSFQERTENKTLRRIVIKAKNFQHRKFEVHSISEDLGLGVIHLSDGKFDVSSLLSELGAHPKIEYAVLDTQVWATNTTPNDPDYRFQWGLPRVGAPSAWTAITSAENKIPNITVCVTDSGVDVTQPDLAANLNPKLGYNAISKNNDIQDGLKHGTHVAGIVSAVVNNNLEVAGLGFDYVKVLSCKFLNDQGYGYVSDAVACIDYCLSMGVDIITNSWAGGEDNPAMKDVIQKASTQGVLLIVAAGNTATDLNATPSYPASYSTEYDNMIVVASTDYNDKLSNFSNYGSSVVHLGAPGEWILSTIPNQNTAYYSGTSMAAPFVAGAAALTLVASGGSMTTADVKNTLLSTAEPLSSLNGKVASGGIVRVDRSVQQGLQAAGRSESPPAVAPASR